MGTPVVRWDPMEPALRNQNYSSGRIPNQVPRATGRRRLPMTGAGREVSDPMFGTETVGWATDLSAKGRGLSSIFCCGDDLRAVHCTLQRLRGCSFEGDLPLGQPDCEAMVLAWKNGEEVTRTHYPSPPYAASFRTYRRVVHRLLTSLVRRPAGPRVGP